MDEKWTVQPSVAEALKQGRSVIALESAFLTHGLPRPANLQTAQAMLAAVQARGSVPAVIAVDRGTIRVGLEEPELAELALRPNVVKAARRDLAWCMEVGVSAGLTVSASIYVAGRVGIRVLATGGIGGVRRVSDKCWDISADLWELARTPIAVVSAGAKSLMDAAATWEWLELLSIPVFGWGTTDWPGFVLGGTGLSLRAHTEQADILARWLLRHWREGGNGVLVAASPPVIVDADEHERALRQAEREAQARGIHGAEWTPFVLQRLAELTQGRSLEANRALLVHNAERAAVLAQALQSASAVSQ